MQMALWRPSDSKVYLPPAPVSKVLSTDDYVTRTNIFYYAGSSRLLTVGHPYFPIRQASGKNRIVVPKVSGYQYRVFRVRLPDPNKFGLPDASLYNPDTQRLVWACKGLEVGRGQPLGIGVSGHPLFNKLNDTENATLFDVNPGEDTRDNVSMDYKQTQLCIIGCKPPLGEHWAKGTPCSGASAAAGSCPPLELASTVIQDGDMVDTGFGAMDFAALQTNRSDVPLDIVTTTCKYPDYLQMAAEPFGDRMFFSLRREQMFLRHFYNRAGTLGEGVPDDYYLKGSPSTSRASPTSSLYASTPSGSMVTSESQLFNKPYWLQRAQGTNNGICWGNQLFVTVVDTSRSTNMSICATKTVESTYKASSFMEYLRHGEEFDLQFIFQLCVINLTAEIMAYLHGMDATLLEDWNFGSLPPPTASLGDTYRFLQSQAITCQKNSPPPAEKKDPYADLTFWEVDLKERFSLELDQFPLGRKFLLQSGTRSRPTALSRKRVAASTTSTAPKRKRVKRSR
ncbi:L1 [human papillomavirus 71]|uniref:Major capsid protein L1 n=4 Tax=Papillomaviridae TaxID=151340 RepID=A0A7L8Y9T1_9PAPI|nr:L1 [human papillomavirus 71]